MNISAVPPPSPKYRTCYDLGLEFSLQGVSQKCPEYKIASKLDNCKITDHQQQPTANIGHQVCISVNFVFICSILLAGGEFKMLNFQVACAQKF